MHNSKTELTKEHLKSSLCACSHRGLACDIHILQIGQSLSFLLPSSCSLKVVCTWHASDQQSLGAVSRGFITLIKLCNNSHIWPGTFPWVLTFTGLRLRGGISLQYSNLQYNALLPASMQFEETSEQESLPRFQGLLLRNMHIKL